MARFDAVREVRIALPVEDFEQAVQFYRDRLGLAVVASKSGSACKATG